ncbi:hypothetical protein K439DRAFT_1643434 [Ramaria rubella]|nr:hypothetical protein K439DRAFT_1643434 [Ramaria rubella]
MDALIQELFNTLHFLRISSFNTIASTSLLLYEVIITSDQEFNFIWRNPLSFISIVYVLLRYYSLSYLLVLSYEAINVSLSEKVRFCKFFSLFQVWGATVFVPVVDILIILRIYALYSQSKKVGVVLVILWIAELICDFIFIGLAFTPGHGVMSNPLPGILPGCYTTVAPEFSQVIRSGAIVSAFQAVYFALTTSKLCQRVRDYGFSLNPLLKVFFRDGAGFCFVILAMYIFITVLFASGPEQLQSIGQTWAISVVSIAASRLVLNIKDVATPSEYFGYRTGGFRMTNVAVRVPRHHMRRDNHDTTLTVQEETSSLPQ